MSTIPFKLNYWYNFSYFESDTRTTFDFKPYFTNLFESSQKLSLEDQIRHAKIILNQNSSKIKIKGILRSKTRNKINQMKKIKLFSKSGLRLTNNLKYKN